MLDDHTYPEIAALLNEKGFRTGEGKYFDPVTLKQLKHVYNLKSRYDRMRERGFITAQEIADMLGYRSTKFTNSARMVTSKAILLVADERYFSCLPTQKLERQFHDFLTSPLGVLAKVFPDRFDEVQYEI